MFDRNMQNALIKLVNKEYSDKVILEDDDYQKIDFYIRDQDLIKNIINEFKFKSIGNVYDYPDALPQPDSINGMDMISNYDLFQRLAISKKFNSIVYYSYEGYSTHCVFLIDMEHLKTFTKKIKVILNQDSGFNLFKNSDFDCKLGEYVEITNSEENEDGVKRLDAIKKKVKNENLIFDKNSTITEVMKDILTFFKPEAQKMYTRLELPYKRGIILYGDPGNGKSAMIRELIRIVPDTSKVIINVDIYNIIKVLKSVIKTLNGRHAMVIIEDIDSMITDYNRSELLNILDGVDITSGIYFIGTTNYPDRIDPAFMNRSGRFDRAYNIGNPSRNTRRKFFKSKNLNKLFEDYDVYQAIEVCDDEREKEIINLFVDYSESLPMASLKELITSTSYMLAADPCISIEEAVIKSYNTLTGDMMSHKESHIRYGNNRMKSMVQYNNMPLGKMGWF